ncbi:MAG: hypothetical protein U0075_10015 [Thermomicrobiales bacterium]|jgi:hypothetical protein
MSGWEYLTIRVQPESEGDQTHLEQLARLGAEGWEAFHVSADGETWFFKRPLSEAAGEAPWNASR